MLVLLNQIQTAWIMQVVMRFHNLNLKKQSLIFVIYTYLSEVHSDNVRRIRRILSSHNLHIHRELILKFGPLRLWLPIVCDCKLSAYWASVRANAAISNIAWSTHHLCIMLCHLLLESWKARTQKFDCYSAKHNIKQPICVYMLIAFIAHAFRVVISVVATAVAVSSLLPLPSPLLSSPSQSQVCVAMAPHVF